MYATFRTTRCPIVHRDHLLGCLWATPASFSSTLIIYRSNMALVAIAPSHPSLAVPSTSQTGTRISHLLASLFTIMAMHVYVQARYKGWKTFPDRTRDVEKDVYLLKVHHLEFLKLYKLDFYCITVLYRSLYVSANMLLHCQPTMKHKRTSSLISFQNHCVEIVSSKSNFTSSTLIGKIKFSCLQTNLHPLQRIFLSAF